MENKLIFKSIPPKAFFIILTLIVVLVVVFGLIILQKSKTTSIVPEVKKEEVSVLVTQEESITEEKPVPVLQKKFTIQVASFQEMAGAEKVYEALKTKGYQPVISTKALPLKVSGRPLPLDKELPEKGTWCRVFVGDFDNEGEAKELLNTLKEVYKDSFIKLR